MAYTPPHMTYVLYAMPSDFAATIGLEKRKYES